MVNRSEPAEALVPGAGDQVVQSVSLPGGSWAVTAKFIAENGGAVGFLACTLQIGGVVVDSLGPGAGIDFDQGAASNTLTGAGSLGGAGSAAVVCNTSQHGRGRHLSGQEHHRGRRGVGRPGVIM